MKRIPAECHTSYLDYAHLIPFHNYWTQQPNPDVQKFHERTWHVVQQGGFQDSKTLWLSTDIYQAIHTSEIHLDHLGRISTWSGDLEWVTIRLYHRFESRDFFLQVMDDLVADRRGNKGSQIAHRGYNCHDIITHGRKQRMRWWKKNKQYNTET